jgi:hypothetical protein
MKGLSRLAFAVLCLALFSLPGLAQKNKFVGVKGKEVVYPDGRPFIMRGTNLGNWLVPEGYMFGFKSTNSPRNIDEAISELVGPDEARRFWQGFLKEYIRYDDIRYLKSTGMNSIRIPFHYKLFTSEHYLGGNDPERGFRLLDSLIEWCRREQLYLLLDMHCAPGGQTGDNIDDSYGYPFLFDSRESRELTIGIWKRIAARYSNEPVIMGYDLLNEPIAHYFDSSHFNPLLEPFYKEITKAVRSVDKNHLVFLGGAQWDSNFGPFGKPFDDKLVYTFHKYWTDTTQDVIQQYLDFRDRHNVPIYVGETGENTDEWVGAFRRLMEKHRIGWHFWPYKKMKNTRGIVDYPQPEGFEKIIDYTEKPRSSFEQVRKAAPADRQKILQILNEVLRLCRYEHCRPNKGYIEALGLTAKPI